MPLLICLLMLPLAFLDGGAWVHPLGSVLSLSWQGVALCCLLGLSAATLLWWRRRSGRSVAHPVEPRQAASASEAEPAALSPPAVDKSVGKLRAGRPSA